jgi:hypothetical protein
MSKFMSKIILTANIRKINEHVQKQKVMSKKQKSYVQKQKVMSKK